MRWLVYIYAKLEGGMPGVQGSADMGSAVWIRQGDYLRPEVQVLSNVCEKSA